MKYILLAGQSASGKSTLARSLTHGDNIVSTSKYLRSLNNNDKDLYRVGKELDHSDYNWVGRLIQTSEVVIDSIRSEAQFKQFSRNNVVTVNIVASDDEIARRHFTRNTIEPDFKPYLFENPDFTWHSDKINIAIATQAIGQLAGRGYVDVLIGGQYGSEGKGKLAALLAHKYNVLIRSGGPNAGHWVRDDLYEFCFHHIPSGAIANRSAQIVIASGATVHPEEFIEEVERTGTAGRLWVDERVVLIQESDRSEEAALRQNIGSTAQGVGRAASRRILRNDVPCANGHTTFKPWLRDVAPLLSRHLMDGSRMMLEGTQGSGLSMYHGPYPFTTSRDTNVGGLLAETGIAPSWVRDIWMVIRTFPIRVGGNSGPMQNELSWEEMATITRRDTEILKTLELTSTTKRLRRVGRFDFDQFAKACEINRPTKLFLTFADYLDPTAVGVNQWGALPETIKEFIVRLEDISRCVVAGVSTGRNQNDVVWCPGYRL